MQEDFNRLVFKVATKGSLQGFQCPYSEDLINLEPCTLWGKYLLEGAQGLCLLQTTGPGLHGASTKHVEQ